MKKILSPLLAAASFYFLLRSATPAEGLLLLLAALLHEAGHVLAARILGCPPKKLSVSPGGLTLEMDFSLIPYKKEMLIYLAGPLTNAAAALITFVLIRFFFNLDLFLFLFCNLIYSVLNLLPVEGLDGYGFLFSLFSLILSPEKAKEILFPVSLFFLFLLIPAGFFLFVKTGNLSLCLFFVMLLAEGKTKKATNPS